MFRTYPFSHSEDDIVMEGTAKIGLVQRRAERVHRFRRFDAVQGKRRRSQPRLRVQHVLAAFQGFDQEHHVGAREKVVRRRRGGGGGAIDPGRAMMDGRIERCGKVGCCLLLVYTLSWGGLVMMSLRFDEKPPLTHRRRTCRCIAPPRRRRFYPSTVPTASTRTPTSRKTP